MAPGPLRIEPFAPVHADAVVALILPIQQTEFGVPITLADQPDLQDVPGFYQRGSGGFWVALDGTDVVGTIAVLDIGNGQGALRKMFVRASHRGARPGVAAGLLATLVAWCRAHGMRELFLGTTAPMLAAHRFYDKNGFREIARTELPKRFPVMSVDTKFYTRAL
jgi:N-acetylglutamate synthase-like GNAT family acetyltransferase